MTALQLRDIRDPLPDPELDAYVRLATIACQVPIAMLTFLDREREWFGAKLGLELGEMPRAASLNAVVVASNELVHVEDASTNELLQHCTLVTGPTGIRLFAGVPLAVAERGVIGVLSVADTAKRSLDESQVEALCLLAGQISNLLQHRASLRSRLEAASKEADELDGLKESQRTLQTLVSNLPGVAYRSLNDISWRLEVVSEGCQKLIGYSAAELIKGTVRMVDIIHPDDIPSLRRKVSRSLKARTPYQSTYRIRTATGQTKWVWDKGCGVYSADGTVLALEGFITDITEQKHAEECIRRMAYFDELTGLPNRLSMRDTLNAAISTSGDSHDPVALLHIEVDNFREINETLGYRESDRLLQEVATRLREAVVASEMVARIAESAFSVLLPGMDASHAVQAARKVLESLSSPFELDTLLVPADCSIGITMFPGHGSDPDSLLRRANVARYGARHSAEKVAVYAGALDSDNAQRLILMTDLRRAIDGDELRLMFQPKLRMHSRRVSGVEALVRWQHPEHGLMGPGQFIGFAESAGLITRLTHWVLAAAVRESHVWHGSGHAVPIAINLSPYDIRDRQLLEQISRALETWGGTPDWIQFELTESCIMEDLSIARHVLTQLREAGFKLFIDDFGTGYSSLAYLRNLPVDYIKIDQSFVKDLDSDSDSAAIVETIIKLAHSLGIEVVAEGVESVSTMQMLSSWGCEEAQGYCISKPISGHDFLAWNKVFV
ncbi:EAL domain-containing protein [Pseudomonas sp. JS3066]|uniref:putative bifunctional diguanylate cyclase/phosphodiesterase n=1 Tax=Pseudomonas sp. JS3066 TaxID=3090665 RepID=UPI002E7AC30C|nr:EAL domain-containing protein [Pseudomonas sp. JS3066]WVK91063.1 EAL domain-containing protein [Pseudomonas sp. JS3066]